jgi:hypothetical protein
MDETEVEPCVWSTFKIIATMYSDLGLVGFFKFKSGPTSNLGQDQVDPGITLDLGHHPFQPRI